MEQFSIDCRKTKTKAIISANHNRPKQCDEPIRIRSNYMQPAQSAGRCARASRDIGFASHWLKKWREVCWPMYKHCKIKIIILRSSKFLSLITRENHRAKQCKTRANTICFRCSIENRSNTWNNVFPSGILQYSGFVPTVPTHFPSTWDAWGQKGGEPGRSEEDKKR